MAKQPLGIGIGLRPDFAKELIRRQPEEVRWFEVHPENYVRRGGESAERLRNARALWPLATHGLSLCLGNHATPEAGYLDALRDFLAEVEAPFHSEHLCFCASNNAHLHDLLPIPRTQESIDHAAARMRWVRDRIGVPLALENVSAYVEDESWMSEIDFVNGVLDAADGRLLLDVNNVFVNATNHGFDARAYIDAVPVERVVQMHIAGHLVRPDGLIIDTHAESVRSEVFDLFRYALERIGPIPVLLERDAKIPPLDELLIEVRELGRVYDEVCG